MQRTWYGTLARFLVRPRVRAVLAWAALCVATAVAYYLAWVTFDEPGRPERTTGYIHIDFSGQWIMGRMLARGEGQYLYNGEHLEAACVDAYGPVDGETVFGWLIAGDDERDVRGPLYPPIQALFFYPLGLLPPLTAYRIVQAVNFSLIFFIAFLFWGLSRGRVWAAVAAGAVLVFPGLPATVALAQNPLISLAILVLGWFLAARGRPWLGGVVWGLLAFKPVWAASFFLVPLLSRRWRFAAAMLLTGLGLALLTLPFTGWRVWLDWLSIGRAASVGYAHFENWIFLSRDLQNIPRRWLFTFQDLHPVNPDPVLKARGVPPDETLADVLGVGLWLTVVGLTVALALWRWPRRRPAGADGPAAAFLMLGAFLSCFHFMYYDMLLAALPVSLLFTDPGRYLRPAYVVPPGPRGGWLWNPAPATLTTLLIVLPHAVNAIDFFTNNGKADIHWPPFDTFCLLGLWAWSGWRWLSRNDE